MTEQNSSSAANHPPVAVVRSAGATGQARMATKLWWLTAVCLVVAIALWASSFRSQGTLINIRFKEGHGLKAGDTLRYRGIDVGSVVSVLLDKDLNAVDVQIRLLVGNESLAVEGSQFWIQRARLSLGGMSGLDTVLGAKYVGVIPGEGARQLQFDGTEAPLAMTEGEGAEIGVRFPSGDGLEVGNPVRFRGIKVGEVTSVVLNENLQAVDVGVRLVGAAEKLARQGTQFWIERPRVDLTEVRGLDTVLQGNYVALQPSMSDSPAARQFDGLAEPPPLPRREGSLEIELDAAQRMGIVRGAPVLYRGLEVGRVAHVRLAKDGATVKVTAVIDTEFVELVRANSKWWSVGGIAFDAGLTGFEVSVESVASWIRGGIAFATPESEPGKQVVNGHRFMLNPRAQDAWLEWQPRIAIGSGGQIADGLPRPVAVRVTATWKSSILGIPRRRSEKTWALPLDDGSLAVPATFSQAADGAGAAVNIEVAGKSYPWSEVKGHASGSVVRLRLTGDEASDSLAEPWKLANTAAATGPDLVLLIVNPELTEPIAVDSTRFEQTTDGHLLIAPGVGLDNGLAGSPVVDSATGKVVGLLAENDGRWIVGKL